MKEVRLYLSTQAQCVFMKYWKQFLSDAFLLLALQQISYSDSNYDNTSVDTEYNNVSVIRN